MQRAALRGLPKASTLLITFDAFGTLFHPRIPVPEQYIATAHQFGLSHPSITPDNLKLAFKDTYRAQACRYPNYGRADVLQGQYGGPRQWWEEVIRGSFTRLLSLENGATYHEEPESLGGNNEDQVKLPAGMVEALLDQFAGPKGYALFDDVLPFFRRVRKLKTAEKWSFNRVIVGVVSNSDDRVPAVLKSLGLTVGDMRADQDRSSMDLPGFEERSIKNKDTQSHNNNLEDPNRELDIDMVITSYEAGEAKPHRLIFDVARRQALEVSRPWLTRETKFVSVHVGDDYKEDYRAARNAGWESYMIRESPPSIDVDVDVKFLPSLMDLAKKLENFP
ncbi:hypothetical protein N7457_006227 [Penicillium paradoxum]|uniref:uncharacterized protein n=1 Tax=Penicillium paradoxum TaxID=176176 RepID=UPI0025489686|nr:uncharacterized protein N7457_006227 [Penicillium paradoxum]KAJ5781067.1 hypothetical protein N7457_006227 [Penicillium paradoxum]